MNKKYRCSCCNEVKNEKSNIFYRLWTQKVKPQESEVVGICKSCDLKMRKVSVIGVKEFIQWVGI